MRILILVLQYPPDPNASGQLVRALADVWAAQGHTVSIVTSFPHYEHFRIWPEYRGKLIERSVRRETSGASRERTDYREVSHSSDVLPPSALRVPALTPHECVSITRVWVHANGTKTMLHRLVSYLSFNVMAAIAGVMERERWDVIFCPNGSFFNGLTGWFLSRGHVPVVYNVQDLYPDVPILAGQLQNGVSIRMLRGIEKFIYRQAAHVTAISSTMVDAIRDKGIATEKTSMIPNFVDTNFIRPLPKKHCVSRRLGLDEKFVVMQAGYIGYAYDLETLLHAAALLKDRDILFIIVGNGVAKGALEKTASELRLSNVRFLPFQPYKDLPSLRAAADVHVSLHKHQSGNYSMPSKVYEIMASGRPLLATSDKGSDVWSLVESTGCGVCVEPGQPEKLTEAILELYRNPEVREEMGERGRECAVEHYSKEAVAGEYLALFRRLTADRRRQTTDWRPPTADRRRRTAEDG